MKVLSPELYKRYSQAVRLPHKDNVLSWVEHLLAFLFPERLEEEFADEQAFMEALQGNQDRLDQLLAIALKADGDSRSTTDIRNQFNEALSEVLSLLEDDLLAIEEGDPAAKNSLLIIATYPGFYAIALYRIAHLLQQLDVPILPRMISELASSSSGIEIHPAAQIGRFFCVDHGGGVVIGETTIIGERVKLYQGVTLGALSVDKTMADQKRHPTIGDRVVIYAGATILGGDTLVGPDSIIGGNVWLTSSVPAFSRLYHEAEVRIKSSLPQPPPIDFSI